MSYKSKRHQIQHLNKQELLSHTTNTTSSWHQAYRSSAYICISNLPLPLTEGDILTVFSQYGEITDLHLLRDTKTGLSKGTAFLCYLDQRSAVLAVDNFNGVEILPGKQITVDHALDYFRMLDLVRLRGASGDHHHHHHERNRDSSGRRPPGRRNTSSKEKNSGGHELVPYLLQQLFGFKRMDTGENYHLDPSYRHITEQEYEDMLELIDRHTLRAAENSSSAAGDDGTSAEQGETLQTAAGNVIFEPEASNTTQHAETTIKKEEDSTLHSEIVPPPLPSGAVADATIIKEEKPRKKKKRKRSSKSSSGSKKKKKKLSKEERAALLKEYQEKCKQVRGVEAKKVDEHLYGFATGFDVRHGDQRKEISSREAYEKLHGYGNSGEIKTSGRSDVDALEKYAYDMRKQRRDEDLAIREQEEKEKLKEKTRRHEERMERDYQRRKRQREQEEGYRDQHGGRR